jgi:hypothetical protein
VLAEHVPEVEVAEPSGVVRLLPAFDHYVVAAPRDREGALPEALKSRVYRAQGWLSPVLLADGRMGKVSGATSAREAGSSSRWNLSSSSRDGYGAAQRRKLSGSPASSEAISSSSGRIRSPSSE